MKITHGMLDALLALHAAASVLKLHPTREQLLKVCEEVGGVDFWINDAKAKRVNEPVEVEA